MTGESPEVAKAIATRLGIKRVVWRQVDFGQLIDELIANRIDVIAAGMFITPERSKRVNFSLPTFRVRQGLLALRGNPKKIQSYKQAAKSDNLTIAVLSGSVEQDLLRQLGLPEKRLIPVPDALTGRVAVESGVADALALSSPTVHWMASQNNLGLTELVTSSNTIETDGSDNLGVGGFAFRKEDKHLLKAWNNALKSFIGTAEHRALIARFGFTEAELPETTARLDASKR